MKTQHIKKATDWKFQISKNTQNPPQMRLPIFWADFGFLWFAEMPILVVSRFFGLSDKLKKEKGRGVWQDPPFSFIVFVLVSLGLVAFLFFEVRLRWGGPYFLFSAFGFWLGLGLERLGWVGAWRAPPHLTLFFWFALFFLCFLFLKTPKKPCSCNFRGFWLFSPKTLFPHLFYFLSLFLFPFQQSIIVFVFQPHFQKKCYFSFAIFLTTFLEHTFFETHFVFIFVLFAVVLFMLFSNIFWGPT